MSGGSSQAECDGEFVPEKFCDEAYDLADDYLAEAMDEMERELRAAVKAGRGGEEQVSIEEKIKTACDNVQDRLQTTIDYNLDIFDRYVKKHVLAAKTAVRPVTSACGSESVEVTPTAAGAAGPAGSGGKREKTGATSARGGGGVESSWGFEVDERTAPKRLEEEAEVDADLQRLRKRRREGLRRRGAMVRKRMRVDAVLMDVDQFVEALQVGVSSSFDDNGLTPVPAKVQEAVKCSAELRAIAARAQGLTKRIGELQAQTSKGTGSGGTSHKGAGNGTAVTSASATARPVDLHAVFERSQQLQVVGAEGVADFSALSASLNG